MAIKVIGYTDEFAGKIKVYNDKRKQVGEITKFGTKHTAKDAIIVDRIPPLNNTPHKYVNNFEVYGTVKYIVNFGDMHKVNINVVSNGYISTVPITFYYNDYRLNSSEVGEAIRVSGIVHTSKHEVNGKMRYYQNYVANGVL